MPKYLVVTKTSRTFVLSVGALIPVKDISPTNFQF